MGRTTPVGDPAGDRPADVVFRMIAATRRRAGARLFVGSAGVAVSAGVALGAALGIVGAAPAWVALAAGGAGLVAAGAWTARHMPSLAETATLLDTRLGLRNRVAAALQLRGDSDAVAALVTRDASARLAAATPADVVPVALGTLHAVLVPLAAVLALWLLWIGPVGSDGPGPVVGSSSTAIPRSTPPREAAQSSAAARVPGDAESNEGTPGARQHTNASAASPDGAPGTQTKPPGAGSREATTAAGTSSVGLEASARRDGVFPSSGGAAPGSRTGASGAGTTGVPGPGSTEGAGGVSGSPAGESSGQDETPSAAGLTARATLARARAEAALARDVIPPDYRDDVRAYFRLLEREGTR